MPLSARLLGGYLRTAESETAVLFPVLFAREVVRQRRSQKHSKAFVALPKGSDTQSGST